MDEDLQTGHRIEGEPAACDEDGEDVAEIAACYHLDVFNTMCGLSSGWEIVIPGRRIT